MTGVYIEITNVCNLQCSFCPSRTLQERRFMDESLFAKCIAEAEKHVSNVYFHILGEPTLHPQFVNYLGLLSETNLKLNLTTNGTTIAKMGDVLLQSKCIRQINISTHAYAELSCDKAEENLENVLQFCKKALQVRPELYINLRLWNVGDAKSDPWNAQMLAEINKTFGTGLELGHFCSRHKSFLVKERLYLHQDSRFEWPTMPKQTQNANGSGYPKGACRALDTHVGILSNGKVVACCLDYQGNIELGDIRKQSLQQILEGEVAQNLKEGFLAHELRHEQCQSCNFCKRFK